MSPPREPPLTTPGTDVLTQGILQAVSAGVVQVGRDGAIITANAEALRILGFSYDALTKRYTADFETETIWEDGTLCPVSEYPVSKALLTGEPQPGATLGVRRPDGKVSWAVFRAVPLKDPETQATTGAVVTFLDITERKQVEKTLLRYQDLLRKAQEIAKVGSWEWDLETQEVMWTDEMFRIHGIDKSDFDGSAEAGIRQVHPDDLEQVQARMSKMLTGEFAGTEYRIIRPDGSIRFVWGSGELIRDAAGKPRLAVGAVQDITERKRVEAEREELEEQLRHSQKMDSVGQLAGGVAHDFNNLLQIILGNAEMHEAPEVLRTRFQDIKLAAERAAELTSQLLSFARRNPIRLRHLEINDLAKTVVRLLRPVIGREVELRFLPGEDLGSVHVDPSLIEQVLVNLCINARDAMPGGGTITLKTRLVDADAAFKTQRAWAVAPSYAAIDVTDTGQGLSPGVQARMFEPFFTTKAPGQGTGLGLSVVFGVVEQHQGGVEVESEIGKGSTFSVYLPHGVGASQQAAPEGPEALPGGHETILVVDDEEQVRDLAVRALEARGYSVLAASNGPEALELLERHLDRVALLLLDVVMPGMRGTEVLRLARKLRADLPVLFTTGYDLQRGGSEEVISEPVLYKPYRSARLLQEIRRIVEG